MVFRFLIRILANNEQLVQKLSESYPMRKAAQIVVRTVFHGKNLIEEKGLNRMMTPEGFKEIMRKIANNFQGQIKEFGEEFKQKRK